MIVLLSFSTLLLMVQQISLFDEDNRGPAFYLCKLLKRKQHYMYLLTILCLFKIRLYKPGHKLPSVIQAYVLSGPVLFGFWLFLAIFVKFWPKICFHILATSIYKNPKKNIRIFLEIFFLGFFSWIFFYIFFI